MPIKPIITAAAAFSALLVTAPLAAQNTAARPAPAQQQQPAAQPAFQVTSVPHICRVREQELINVNRNVQNVNAALQREKDPAKRQQIGQQMQGQVNALRETEASWDRMGCAQLLYGVRAN